MAVACAAPTDDPSDPQPEATAPAPAVEGVDPSIEPKCVHIVLTTGESGEDPRYPCDHSGVAGGGGGGGGGGGLTHAEFCSLQKTLCLIRCAQIFKGAMRNDCYAGCNQIENGCKGR